jgi:hypothetical protein
MDPTACYREMKLAMLDGDFETAREHALNLKRWFKVGGFEPEGENPLEVKGHLARVLRITTPGALPEPEIFSLTCSECDYGDGITTEAEAIEEGWSDICPAPDLPMANFVGLCPCCRDPFDD